MVTVCSYENCSNLGSRCAPSRTTCPRLQAPCPLLKLGELEILTTYGENLASSKKQAVFPEDGGSTLQNKQNSNRRRAKAIIADDDNNFWRRYVNLWLRAKS